MEIILTKYCRSLTGTLSRSHGYCIRRVRDRFYSKRNTNARDILNLEQQINNM